MTPLASKGVYAGIKYRVLPDSSIEAMLPEGLVIFKTIEQFLAATANVKNINSNSRLTSSDVLDNGVTHRANIPAQSRPIDYYSILLEAIHKTETNSAQLRALVYERARFNLKREFLFGYSSLGLSEVVQHVNDFELAIARIEANAEYGEPSPDYRDQEKGHEIHRVSRRSAGQFIAPKQTLFEDQSSYQQKNREPGWQPNKALPYLRPALFLPLSALFAVAFVGAAVIAGVSWRSPTEHSRNEITLKSPSAAEKVVSRSNSIRENARPTDNSAKVLFPLPTSFGIYALSDNKLFKLETLAIRVPDPRVALSAEIKTSSVTNILGSKPAFIIFRRDLLTNAPEMVALRVIARINHETTFVGGKPSTMKVEGVWRIRNTSFRYKVSPVPGQTEMVLAQSEGDQPLAAGRYALVLNGLGYDFTINGPTESLAHCLDAFEALNGTVFSECRKPQPADHTNSRF